MANLIHPRLLSKLTAFFPNACTIQAATSTPDGYGQETQVWADAAGLVDLKCAIEPLSADEVRAAEMTYGVATHRILLAGHYPGIATTMRAMVGGVAWDIVAVEGDLLGTLTALKVRRVRL